MLYSESNDKGTGTTDIDILSPLGAHKPTERLNSFTKVPKLNSMEYLHPDPMRLNQALIIPAYRRPMINYILP